MGQAVTILIPSDRLDEEPQILERIRQGERVDHFETIRRRKDGTLLHISLTISPLRNQDGLIFGASKIARDITELHLAREQQAMLLKEMQHRVKNIFAVASGLIRLLASKASTPLDLAAMAGDRMSALARAHELTVVDPDIGAEVPHQPTTLHALLRALAEPFVSGEDDRLAVEGRDAAIGSKSITPLALVLNELVTNAAKHGAWSGAEGKVSVRSDLADGVLTVCWREKGAADIQPPTRSGFGEKLSELAVERQLGGRLTREWQPEGLCVMLAVNQDRL